jgi:hypothetical protein
VRWHPAELKKEMGANKTRKRRKKEKIVNLVKTEASTVSRRPLSSGNIIKEANGG